METEEQALLNSVIASPEDDAPRLVFADWYREHGQEERAELIHVGIELCRLGECPHGRGESVVDQVLSCGCRWCCLKRRQNSLAMAHGQEWAGEPLSRYPDAYYVYDRGFVRHVSMRLAEFEVCSTNWRLFRRHPITNVVLTDRRPVTSEGGRGARWVFREGGYDHPCYLPRALFDRLPCGPRCTTVRDSGEGGWHSVFSLRDYESVGAAQNELSQACVSYGRAVAKRVKADCPLCGAEHDSDDHDLDWYFHTCCWEMLVWVLGREGPELKKATIKIDSEGPMYENVDLYEGLIWPTK